LLRHVHAILGDDVYNRFGNIIKVPSRGAELPFEACYNSPQDCVGNSARRPRNISAFVVTPEETQTSNTTIRQRSLVRSTSLRKEMFFGRVESQYLAGFFSPSGHSINSHSSGWLSERV
jgi:hypothetical protein